MQTLKRRFHTTGYISNSRLRQNDDAPLPTAPPTKVAFCRKTHYEFGSNVRLNWRPMTRPAEYTRQSIIKAAVTLFAEKGFEGSSVRDIVTKARVLSLIHISEPT